MEETNQSVEQRPQGKEWLLHQIGRVRGLCARPMWLIGILTLLSLLVIVPTLWLATQSYPSLLDAPIWSSYLQKPLILLVNVLPPLVMLWGITLLLNRPWAGYLIMTMVSLALSLGNYFKISLRGDPVTLYDLTLLGDAAKVAGEYTLTLSPAVWLVIVCAILGFGLVILLLPFKMGLSWGKRILATILSAALGYGLFTGVYTNANIYEQTRNEENISRWSITESYISRGLWYSFLNSAVDHSVEFINGYTGSIEELLALRSANKTANIQPIEGVTDDIGLTEIVDLPIIPREERTVSADQDISVVSIMLEAFCDLTDYESLAQYEGVREAYSIWNQLEEESLHGNLITNSFGGGTVNTEWGFLTGLPDYGPFTYNTDSYVWYLRSLGYTTQGSHPGYCDFYDRVEINHYLGFESYRFGENYYGQFIDPAAAFWRSDDILVDGILADLEGSLSQGDAVFSFSVSYQNHGPYDVAAEMEDAYIPDDSDLSDETRGIIQSYLNGISNSLEEMERLTQELNAMPEPVVLVLFGDHKPWLGNAYGCYIDADISFDQSTDEGVFNYYSTPYLIWSNEAARQQLGQVPTGQGETISPCFLMNQVFEYCGWEQPAAMEISTEMMEITPVVHQTGRYLYNDTYVDGLDSPYDLQMQEFLALHKYRREQVYTP